MSTASRRAAAVLAAVSSPLAAVAAVAAQTAEGPGDASTAWHLLGTLAPAVLWGVPLAYVVFTVASHLPRPGGPRGLPPPRDGSLLDRTSIPYDPRDGW